MGQVVCRVTTQVEKDNHYKSWAISAARDFGYGNDVVAKIKAAKTDDQISRIMATARNEKRW